MSDKVREQFEADANLRWHPDAKGPGLLDRDPADGYYNTAVEYAWRAWQAARAEALEEAALWHEDEARRISGEIAASLQIMRENASAFVGLNTSMDHEYAQAETHREAAASIRALKDKEPA